MLWAPTVTVTSQTDSDSEAAVDDRDRDSDRGLGPEMIRLLVTSGWPRPGRGGAGAGGTLVWSQDHVTFESLASLRAEPPAAPGAEPWQSRVKSQVALNQDSDRLVTRT